MNNVSRNLQISASALALVAAALLTASMSVHADSARPSDEKKPNVAADSGAFSYFENNTTYYLEKRQLSSPVRIADLDLLTPAGTTELQRRIAAAAAALCGQLRAKDSIDDGRCIKTASADALAKARVLVEAAEKRANAVLFADEGKPAAAD